jgi:hypothetical protein
MWFYKLKQEQTEKTENSIAPFPLLPPVRIALTAFVLLANSSSRNVSVILGGV